MELDTSEAGTMRKYILSEINDNELSDRLLKEICRRGNVNYLLLDANVVVICYRDNYGQPRPTYRVETFFITKYRPSVNFQAIVGSTDRLGYHRHSQDGHIAVWNSRPEEDFMIWTLCYHTSYGRALLEKRMLQITGSYFRATKLILQELTKQADNKLEIIEPLNDKLNHILKYATRPHR